MTNSNTMKTTRINKLRKPKAHHFPFFTLLNHQITHLCIISTPRTTTCCITMTFSHQLVINKRVMKPSYCKSTCSSITYDSRGTQPQLLKATFFDHVVPFSIDAFNCLFKHVWEVACISVILQTAEILIWDSKSCTENCSDSSNTPRLKLCEYKMVP